MYRPKLPKYRKLNPGIDLPRWFIDDLKAIDPNFKFVYHKWRTLWDDVINGYAGSMEDPRFCIGEFQGYECWGWPLRGLDGDPILDEKWHVWRLAPGYGWSHVINIDSTDPEHLRKIVSTVYEEALARDMGFKAYSRYRKEKAEREQEKREEVVKDKFEFLEKENRKLTRDAMENFSLGRVKPTNPTKDIITSYKGQSNRSRIVRPIDDKEGGLVSWEDLN